MATEILSFILFIDHCCIHDGAEQKEILIFVVHSLFTKLLITITSTSHDRHDHYSLLTSLMVCVCSTSTSLGAVSMLSDISVLIAISIWPLKKWKSDIQGSRSILGSDGLMNES